MKVEYKTRPRKEVTIIITNDLDTSSKSELKKLFPQDIPSFQKRSNSIE
ncbi:hypothetical protein RSSL_01504 [Streptococcus salivarius K12]|uniref:Uncharacterized protein n=1 Tax=Streptococcus salivarius K12 TaxID=1200793 RepID=J7TXG2_STRSL|nr:hypothetical protein RSSL_01504 [Streptococcus salivarius K12]